jgi:hypothetical protein
MKIHTLNGVRKDNNQSEVIQYFVKEENMFRELMWKIKNTWATDTYKAYYPGEINTQDEVNK